MKKYLMYSIIILLTAILAIISPVTTSIQAQASIQENSVENTQAQIMPLSLSEQSIIPLTTNSGTTSVETIIDGTSGPSDLISQPVYTEDNEKIFMLKETGLLVTEQGEPIMDPNNSSVTRFDTETQSYVNGADQKMAIWLDSFLDTAYLKSGGTVLTKVPTKDTTLYLIAYKINGVETLIYSTRAKINYSVGYLFFHPEKLFVTDYRYFDMNGRALIEKNIVKDYNFGSALYAFYSLPGAIWDWITGTERQGVPFAKIYEKCTVAELMEELEHITVHPYATVEGVITEDGSAVYIRPFAPYQCVDKTNYPLFSIDSGRPLFFYEGQIIDSNLQAPEIRNGILRNIFTTWQLIEGNTSFYMGIIETVFGNIDAVIFNISNDINKPEWVFPNGESAKGVIKDAILAGSLDKKDIFTAVLGGIGDAVSSVFNGAITIITSALDAIVSVFNFLVEIFKFLISNFWIILIIIILIIVCWPLIKKLFNFKKTKVSRTKSKPKTNSKKRSS